MKTELKTAEEKYNEMFTSECMVISKDEAIAAIESHTSERLDHLRQQFENRTIKGSMEVASVGHQWATKAKIDAFKEAISLIDQLKAETKNT